MIPIYPPERLPAPTRCPRGAARGIAAAALLLACFSQAHAADLLRPELGKPLQAAQQLIRSQRYKEALAKVREADSAGVKSAFETATVERMRLAAASGAGDFDAASRAFSALDSAGQIAGADKLRAIEAITGAAYRSGQHAQTAQWARRYTAAGGGSPTVRTLLVQSQYQSGDYAGVIREVIGDIQTAERARTVPPEDRIKLLLGAAGKLGDNERYVYGIEKLLTYHPKKQYWGDLLPRLQSRPQVAGRFALDAFRLALATDSLGRAEDYVEYAQLAAQAGYPVEGKQVLDKGYAAGLLGQGADAARHKRLRDLLDKRSAEDRAAWAQAEVQARAAQDAAALVRLGFNRVVAGEAARGVALIQEGVGRSRSPDADAARLHLGIAQVLSGQASQAGATFRAVSGSGAAADLARYWSLYVKARIGTA